MPDFGSVFNGLGGWDGNGTIADLSGKNNGKRILVLFIVDATKSMEGVAIGQVNYALTELFSDMKEFASNNLLNMELGIMSFSNSVKWEMTPEDINNCFAVPQINVRPGNTQYGVVYNELNKRLNKNDLLKETGKQAAPVLVFLTDGAPVDDYKYDMEQLRKNGYFMLANRSVVIMGEGVNDPKARAAAAEFTLDEHMVLTTDNTSEIVNAIKLATLHTLKGTEISPDPGVTDTKPTDPFDLGAGGNPAPSPMNTPPTDPFGLGNGGNPAPSPTNTSPADPVGLGNGGNPAPSPTNTSPTDPFGLGNGGNPAPSPTNTSSTDPFGAGTGEEPAVDLGDPFADLDDK